MKALNAAGGPTIKVMDPSTKGHKNAATTPKQGRTWSVSRSPKELNCESVCHR